MGDSCCWTHKTKDKKLGEVMGIMSEIRTAEDAITKAESFVFKYYSFHRLETVKKAADSWVVRFDVAVLGPKQIVTVKLDKDTGDVLEFTSAES